MKQHVELAIIVAMSAMMVFGAAAFVMPYVYALTSSSTGSGGSGTSGASGAAATGSKPGAGGAGDNKGSTTSGGSTTGGSTSGGSSSPPPKTTPPPVSKPPPKPPSKVPFCKPGSCLGTPHYYTLKGHHHCYDGYPGCVCNSSRAACGANYGKP
jgi:hypothetical protein